MLTFVLVQELFSENGDIKGGEAIAVPTLAQTRGKVSVEGHPDALGTSPWVGVGGLLEPLRSEPV